MSASKLTAAKALEISGVNNCEVASELGLAGILDEVHAAALLGQTSIKSYKADFGGSHLYGGKPTAVQLSILSKLKALGYRAEVRCEERQFVDIYLSVSWGVLA